MNIILRHYLFFSILCLPLVLKAQWELTGGPFGIRDPEVKFQNDQYLFACTETQWLRSPDGGDTWEKINYGLPFLYNNTPSPVFAFSDSIIFVLIRDGRYNGLGYLSKNNGNSWDSVTLPFPVYNEPLSITLINNVLFISDFDNFFASSDFGNTWSPVYFPNSTLTSGGTLQSYQGRLYVQASQHGVFYSDDLGETWVQINLPTALTSNAIFRAYGNLLLLKPAENSDNIFFSADHGINWIEKSNWSSTSVDYITQISNGDIYVYGKYGIPAKISIRKLNVSDFTYNVVLSQFGIHKLFIDKDGIFYLKEVGEYNHLYRSTDFGETLEQLYPNAHGNSGRIKYKNGELLVATIGQIKRISTQNWNWSYDGMTPNSDDPTSIIDFYESGDTVLAFDSNRKLYLSIDSGQTWPSIISPSAIHNLVTGYNRFTVINQHIFIYGPFGMYHSSDFGNTWEDFDTWFLQIYGAKPSSVILHQGSIFLATNTGIFRSDDNGTTWMTKNIGINLTYIPPPSNYDFTAMQSVDDVIFISRVGGLMYMSSDNGENWTRCDNGLATIGNYASGDFYIEKFGNNLVCNINSGLYISYNNGLNWIPLEFNPWISSIEKMGDTLLASSSGLGVIKRAIQPIPYQVFRGRVFYDTNNNQIFEAFEQPGSSIDLDLIKTHQSLVTDPDGTYEVYVPLTGADISLDLPNNNHSIITPQSYDLVDTDFSYDFAIYDPLFNPASGVVFVDANNNGTQDVGEDGLADAIIYFSQFTNIARTDSAGAYLISVPAIDDTIRVNPHHKYAVLTPPFYVTIPDSNEYNFAVNYPTNIHDASVSIYPSGSATRGFTHDYIILVKNEGTEVDSVSVQVELDPQLELLQMNVPAQSANGNILSWIIPSPPVSQYSIIALTVKVPTDTPLGNEIEVNATVNIEGFTDADIEDNAVTLTQEVVGSYDPNDKQVMPSGDFFTTQIGEGEGLNYTIRFQNTGTAPARKVVILDTLDVDLDFSTLEIMAFSHPMTWNLRDTGIIEFIFDNINLPDSTSNEPESHGFVAYSIKCPKDIIQGSEIKNAADIYFDFNEPIRTNTVTSPIKRSEIVQLVATFTLCEGDILNGQVYETSTVIGDTVSFEFFDSIYLTQINVLPTYFANVDTSAALGTVFLGQTINTDTTISLSLLASNGCDSTVVYEIKVLTGNIETIEEAQGFRIIPNPTNGVATIEFYGLVNLGGTLSVSNPLGQQLLQVAVKSSEKIQLDLSGQAQGIYFVKFDSHKGSMTKRLLKT